MRADTAAAPARAHATTGASAGHPVMHTAEEAARLLKVKRSWLERQAAARKIPFSMLGGSYRFSDRHLAEIIRLNEVVPAQGARNAPRPARPTGSMRPGPELTAAVNQPLRARPRTGPRHA